MNILSIFSAVVISILAGFSIYLVYREKSKLIAMSGMMIAMAIAAATGLMTGYLLGIFSGVMFLSCGVSIIIGFIIGLLAGQPIGLMAIIVGILSGILSGIIGSLLGVMLKFENPSIMLGILLGLSILILGLVILFIRVETNGKFSLDTQTISPFAILSTGAVLIALFLFLYSSDLVKVPTYHTAAASQADTQTEVDVTAQAEPTINMQVTQTGYSPNFIHVKKGVPVKLVIENPLENSCLSTFTMPSFNKNHINLKVGINSLSFTPAKAGEYSFSCGMGMFKGTVIVE